MGHGDENTDADDSKGRGGLDDHRGDIGVHPGHLWTELFPQECSHPQEAKADHRGDDDVQAHGQRDPRYAALKRAVHDGELR
jgi:hypothetical protein